MNKGAEAILKSLILLREGSCDSKLISVFAQCVYVRYLLAVGL